MNVTIHPEWKHAVVAFLANDPKPGDVVTREQLEHWFSLKYPAHGSREEFEKHNLRFLALRSKFFDELMRKHQVQLSEKEQKRGGWRVLAPNEVAGFTRQQSTKELKKAIRKQRDRLAFTDLSALTSAELREHAEVLVRSSWKLRALNEVDRKPVEFPAPPKALPRKT